VEVVQEMGRDLLLACTGFSAVHRRRWGVDLVSAKSWVELVVVSVAFLATKLQEQGL